MDAQVTIDSFRDFAKILNGDLLMPVRRCDGRTHYAWCPQTPKTVGIIETWQEVCPIVTVGECPAVNFTLDIYRLVGDRHGEAETNAHKIITLDPNFTRTSSLNG